MKSNSEDAVSRVNQIPGSSFLVPIFQDLFVVFILSFGIRLFIYYLGGYHSIRGDEGVYWRVAHAMMRGHYGSGSYMPGWPWLLSLVLGVSNQLVTAHIFTMFLGSMGSIFVYLIGQRVFGRKTGLIAGVLFAIHPEHVAMSHYLYAEVGLTTLTAFLSYLVFRSFPFSIRNVAFFITAFLFGVSLFYKHFIGINFMAWLVVIIFHEKRSSIKIFFAVLFFCLPLLFYSFAMKSQHRDPAQILRSPFKSMREWHVNQISRGPREKRISYLAKSFIERNLAASPFYFFHRVEDNLQRLWGAQSYPVWRLKKHKYSKSIPIRPAVFIISLFHLIILVTGVTGLCFSERSSFHTYAVASLLGLTLMSAQFLMMPRYHLPSMFLLIIYAASLLSQARFVSRLERLSFGRFSLWVFLLGGIFINAIKTWP